jgi:hypothetical protein
VLLSTIDPEGPKDLTGGGHRTGHRTHKKKKKFMRIGMRWKIHHRAMAAKEIRRSIFVRISLFPFLKLKGFENMWQ